MDLRTALGEPPSSFSFARRMRSRLAASTSLRLASRLCASSPRRPRLESMPRTPEGRAASRAARAWLSLRDHSLASRSLTSCPTWESQRDENRNKTTCVARARCVYMHTRLVLYAVVWRLRGDAPRRDRGLPPNTRGDPAPCPNDRPPKPRAARGCSLRSAPGFEAGSQA